MPTYSQLSSEPPPGGTAWLAQITPGNMNTHLIVPLRTLYSLGPSSIGAAGDNNHLYGRHRSRDWDLSSRYCTNPSYGTTDARDKRGAGNIYRAVDIGIQGQPLWDACHRLDAAVRAGKLPGVAEWFGTFDGKTVVGWYQGHASSSDSSHLYHGHIGFWNESADDVATMRATYATFTGKALEDDMIAHLWKDTTGQYWYVTGPLAMRQKVNQQQVDTIRYYSTYAGGFTLIDLSFGTPISPATVSLLGVDITGLDDIGTLELTPEQMAQVTAAAQAGAEAGAPTHEELVAAAEEGANLAEDS